MKKKRCLMPPPSPTDKLDTAPKRIAFAHALRGLAAVSVILSHFFGAFWLKPSSVGFLLQLPELKVDVPPLFAPLHFSESLNYGSFGVAVFFLISGFVIPFSLERLSGRGFAVARLLRIYPVYMLCFALSMGAVALMNHFYAAGRDFPIAGKTVVTQFFLLRGWLWVPSPDGISWTLEIELIFYALAALMASGIVGKRPSLPMLVGYGFVAMLLCLIGNSLVPALHGGAQAALYYATFALPYTIYMFIGTFFYLSAKGRIGYASLVGGVLACLFAFSIAMESHVSLKTLDLSSYYFAVALFGAFFAARGSFHSNKWLDRLADISYPLYAVHALTGYSVMYALTSSGAPALVSACSALALSLTLATAIHFLVEKPTTRLGKTLAKRWFPKKD